MEKDNKKKQNILNEKIM